MPGNMLNSKWFSPFSQLKVKIAIRSISLAPPLKPHSLLWQRCQCLCHQIWMHSILVQRVNAGHKQARLAGIRRIVRTVGNRFENVVKFATQCERFGAHRIRVRLQWIHIDCDTFLIALATFVHIETVPKRTVCIARPCQLGIFVEFRHRNVCQVQCDSAILRLWTRVADQDVQHKAHARKGRAEYQEDHRTFVCAFGDWHKSLFDGARRFGHVCVWMLRDAEWCINLLWNSVFIVDRELNTWFFARLWALFSEFTVDFCKNTHYTAQIRRNEYIFFWRSLFCVHLFRKWQLCRFHRVDYTTTDGALYFLQKTYQLLQFQIKSTFKICHAWKLDTSKQTAAFHKQNKSSVFFSK